MDERKLQIFLDSLLPLFKAGVAYTIPLALVSFVLGLLLAVATALVRLSSWRIPELIARFYVWIIRGTPLLVQLFIIFYGLPSAGIVLDPFIAAVIGFTLSVGAYSSEIVRAAILSIPKGQWEAAYSVGMTRGQALRRIILPQAARVSVPPLANSFISLVKDTSLAAGITYVEMFRTAQQITATTYEPLLLYSEAALFYLLFCSVLSGLQNVLEKRFDRYTAR
ncbi:MULTISPECIES: amino acid ABC transporter permease [unclassified Paenibacillus]|uniref:amino acid ABC transporter permease n=1 Tax=unclassified Paenibacillus TaxID=185978 RepID=UPI002407007B|nr:MULTISPECIES: amino acid ABC transporter permease [unclassified Paenibacillus]MDF9842995.1 cystine transport system permease protein [Paenibacillus sp. PastF-2]MDF9849583.1 cystine transport system permease protein [Paenibacillus sp. PastM-2]MDF9856042.1 cystine transport system permease protein [Paenibacillus sp. PastF-1]MDH6481426.1 cystine transport system permease protein [Paenibacillus sp. PastH-2]MDH6508731.1 cystine transport system permease protein [Paenibacillus sp. PastM-3]